MQRHVSHTTWNIVQCWSLVNKTLRKRKPVTLNAFWPVQYSEAGFSGFLVRFYQISSSTWQMGPLAWGGLPCDLIPVPRTPSQSQTPQSATLHCFTVQSTVEMCCWSKWREGDGAHTRLAFLQKLGDETWRVPAWGGAPVWRWRWGWNGNIWLTRYSSNSTIM